MRFERFVMPTSAELSGPLLDTSAAVAFVLQSQDFHLSARDRLRSVSGKGLSGHAEFETFSVLTRLPASYRLTSTDADRVMRTNFPAPHHLTHSESQTAVRRLIRAGISGGAVYDGLVALAAVSSGRLLITCDTRAAGTYRALGAAFELLEK